MRETDMDIIELIKDNYNSFTRLQKVVGDYILEKIDSVVFLSLHRICRLFRYAGRDSQTGVEQKKSAKQIGH